VKITIMGEQIPPVECGLLASFAAELLYFWNRGVGVEAEVEITLHDNGQVSFQVSCQGKTVGVPIVGVSDTAVVTSDRHLGWTDRVNRLMHDLDIQPVARRSVAG